MKKGKMIIFTLLMTLVTTLFVTGCANKKEELVFDSKEGSFTLSVDHSAGYKISTDSKDFRSSREQAMLIGKDFSIGIEFNDDLDYFFEGDFEKLKKTRVEENKATEVTYSNIKGIQYFYDGYMNYNVILPIEGSNKYTLNLSVYGKDETKEAAKEAIESKEVVDILNNIKDIKLK